MCGLSLPSPPLGQCGIASPESDLDPPWLCLSPAPLRLKDQGTNQSNSCSVKRNPRLLSHEGCRPWDQQDGGKRAGPGCSLRALTASLSPRVSPPGEGRCGMDTLSLPCLETAAGMERGGIGRDRMGFSSSSRLHHRPPRGPRGKPQLCSSTASSTSLPG